MLRKYKKITKKELKKDPLVLLTAQAMDYLKTEWVKIGSTFLAVILIVAVSLLIVQGRKHGEVKSYDAAMAALEKNAPETNDLLRTFVNKYSGSDYAGEALIQLGNRYFIAKDYAKSENCFNEYIKKYASDPVLGFDAYNNLGSVLEQKGDFKGAAGIYESFTQKFKSSVFESIMVMNAGKAYLLAGDKESAKKSFQRIASQYRDSAEMQEALYYLGALQ
jgi:TolA-binding protein